jgi:hypothetical protein
LVHTDKDDRGVNIDSVYYVKKNWNIIVMFLNTF